MKHIVWIGHDYFQSSLTACDWEVHYFNFDEFQIFNWESIVNMAGCEPHVVVVADKSLPPFVLGIENFPCITVFYSVDSHIHSWFSNYAQAFDFCLVSLHDHVDFFKNKNLASERIMWCPPFARDTDSPNQHVEPQYDCLFVGSIHAENLPNRLIFLKKLEKYVPNLHIEQGAYAKLFPLGRVLINHCENADLNFRVFEALGCGGALVTPQVEHGLNKLFTSGKELMTYESGNAEAAAKLINELLANNSLRQSIAEQGLLAVNNKHRAIHRAQSFTKLINSVPWQDTINKRLTSSANIRKIWLRQIYLLFAEVMQGEQVREAYLKAAL